MDSTKMNDQIQKDSKKSAANPFPVPVIVDERKATETAAMVQGQVQNSGINVNAMDQPVKKAKGPLWQRPKYIRSKVLEERKQQIYNRKISISEIKNVNDVKRYSLQKLKSVKNKMTGKRSEKTDYDKMIREDMYFEHLMGNEEPQWVRNKIISNIDALSEKQGDIVLKYGKDKDTGEVVVTGKSYTNDAYKAELDIDSEYCSNLLDKKKSSLYDYSLESTDYNYKSMNKALRSDIYLKKKGIKTQTDKSKKHLEKENYDRISSIIETLKDKKTDKDIVLSRTSNIIGMGIALGIVKPSELTGDEDADTQKIESMLENEEFLEELNLGKTMSYDKGFVSTTAFRNGASYFKYQNSPLKKHNRVEFKIMSHAGTNALYISSLSKYQNTDEEEVLLQAGTPLRILKVVPETFVDPILQIKLKKYIVYAETTEINPLEGKTRKAQISSVNNPVMPKKTQVIGTHRVSNVKK